MKTQAEILGTLLEPPLQDALGSKVAPVDSTGGIQSTYFYDLFRKHHRFRDFRPMPGITG